MLDKVWSADFESVKILCNSKGIIVDLNGRATVYGLRLGAQLQSYLVDVRNQRSWMQILAEVSSEDVPLLDQCFYLSLSVGNCRLAFECYFRSCSVSVSSPVGANSETQFETTSTSEIFVLLSGIQFEQHHFSTSSPGLLYPTSSATSLLEQQNNFVVADAVERKYLYDMCFLNSSDNAVIATDRNGRVIFYNSVAEQIYGYTVDEILGNNVVEFLSSESSKEYGHEIMESLIRGNHWSGSYMIRCKSGQEILTYVTDYPILNRFGKLIGIVGVSCLADGNTVRSGDGVSQHRPHRRSVSSNPSHDPAALLHKKDFLVEWGNDRFFQELGTANFITGQKLTDMDFMRSGKVALRDGLVFEVPSGKTFQVEIHDIDTYGRSFCLFRDVTTKQKLLVSLKAAADEAETHSFKTDFITTMSHEMRTPLHAMLSEIEELESLVSGSVPRTSSAYDRLVESLGALRYSYNLQYLLVKNVLDWQKLASGKFELCNMDFSLKHLIQSVLRNNRFFEKLRQLTVTVSIDESIPKSIVADHLKVTQILLNLVTNAEKYTDAGTQLEIKAELMPENKIKISVIDCGKGIPPTMIHLLFQRFAQIHLRKPDQGVGLGLSISQQLVSMIGGDIGYEARKDRPGSCFWFWFPFEKADSEMNSSPSTPDSNLGSSSNSSVFSEPSSPLRQQQYPTNLQKVASDPLPTPKHSPGKSKFKSLAPILIAEDNEINQRSLERMLIKMGFAKEDVDIADDGLVALNRSESRHYSVILMDMSMPNMDGIEASAELRKRGYQGHIFGVTANAMEQHRESCFKAGMEEFLVKPLQFDTLTRLFERLLPLPQHQHE